nr:ribonucleotide-diphosphate reductase subunit beta [Mitsuokella multacida]
MASLKKRPLFNPEGDIDVTQRRLIGGNTTNMNDFNNLKYTWTADWYRQAMNNFWIPEEINLGQDVKDYRQLPAAERRAYARSSRSSSSSTRCRARTCRTSRPTSRPTRSTSA